MKYGKFILLLFIILLLGNALNAYNIGDIPIEWISYVGFIALALFVLMTDKLYIVPGSKLMLSFFLWAMAVTVLNIFFKDYGSLMPRLTTTTYPVFVTLRFLRILSFIATIYLVYWLLRSEYKESLIRYTVIIGTVISILSIYILIAQIFGLPEFFRSRNLIIGAPQSVRIFTVFDYRYYRAMGTFIEPGFLGEWLIVPFFLSLKFRNHMFNVNSFLIGLTIFLTFSLGTILAIACGVAGAILFLNPIRLMNIKKLRRMALIALFILAFYFSVNKIYALLGTNIPTIWQLFMDRIEPILEGGMKSSNRYYIYDYLSNNPIPFVGYGVGNSAIILSHYFNSELMMSHVSLYINIICATGIIGLILFYLFLLFPVFGLNKVKRMREGRENLLFLASFLSCLVAFAVISEELTIMFAITYAFLVYEIKRVKKLMSYNYNLGGLNGVAT